MATLLPSVEPSVFRDRRSRLAERIGATPALLFAGGYRSRNYPDNIYRFRAASHFLYFTGAQIPDAVLVGSSVGWELFIEPDGPSHALWHGETPGPEQIAAATGVERVRPLAELADTVAALGGPEAVATLPATEPLTRAGQGSLLERDWGRATGIVTALGERDAKLADAVIDTRLRIDSAGLEQMREAASATLAGHLAGMAITAPGVPEYRVRAAIEHEFFARGMQCAYGSIVSVHGEVLHNDTHLGTLQPGDLLLADAGAEHDGWASDVTRTWPVTGRFSATQRAIYELVLHVQIEACDRVRAGARYRDIHLGAGVSLARGLVDLGILHGDPENLVERGAHALFFPHGLGHLIGLDVHDMEDLGDRAGYQAGRARSDQFGLGYLRLDRDLEPGMVVTIEPGFYQVPAILDHEELGGRFARDGTLNRSALERFHDVRGIRIEDDVLCTEGHPQVLTRDIPKDPAGVEGHVGSAR